MSSQGLRKDRAHGVALMQAMPWEGIQSMAFVVLESLVRCVLRIDFAFSTFPEDWGL